MNSPPKPPTIINSRGHPKEFEPIIQAKSHNFVGREFVFTAINNFLHRHHQGYFTIIGAPGSGKSAILAKYVTDNPLVVYYNVEETRSLASLQNVNSVDRFLEFVCTQLVHQYSLNYTSLPDNATEGSWFLSSLLQQISDKLQPEQKLIIAIDGLNCIDRNNQPPGTNLFYLPRYLPDGVYFLLTRRPFLREKSGLLIETPSQSLDLADYPAQNQQDIQAYIQNYPSLGNKSDRLTALSENNFMYISQIIQAILVGFDSESWEYDEFPPNLAAYYQQHLQNMLSSASNKELQLAVLKILIQHQPITAEALAQLIDADEYEIEEILDTWLEYLTQQQNNAETLYSLYHSNFRHWLSQQVIQ